MKESSEISVVLMLWLMTMKKLLNFTRTTSKNLTDPILYLI